MSDNPSPRPAAEGERDERFEEWHTAVFGAEREDGSSAYSRTPMGFYRDNRVMMRYQGWQARAQAETVDELFDIMFRADHTDDAKPEDDPEWARWCRRAAEAIVAARHDAALRGEEGK